MNLSTPYPETSLLVSRNNIAGILLGLSVMWLVFDQLGSKPAAEVMSETFSSNLKLMARLATPWPRGQVADLAEIRTLREKISQNFAAVNPQSDAVLFEPGSLRQQSLETRAVLLSAQPLLRTLFLLEIATLQYRVPIAPRDLPPAILREQVRFDEALRKVFEQLAAGLPKGEVGETVPASSFAEVRGAWRGLDRSVSEAYGSNPTARAQAVLALVGHLVSVVERLGKELRRVADPTLPDAGQGRNTMKVERSRGTSRK